MILAAQTGARVLDERFTLSGANLHLDILAEGRFVAAELVNRREVVVAVAPLVAIGTRHSGAFDLARVDVGDRYSIVLRAVSNERHGFGALLIRNAMMLGGADKAATAEFRVGSEERHARVGVDIARLGFYLAVSAAAAPGPKAAEKRGQQASAVRRSNASAAMETKLWSGFSVPALQALHQMIRAPEPADRYGAASALARWYVSTGEYARALEFIETRRTIGRSRIDSRETALLEAECLLALGEWKEARATLKRAMRLFGEADADLCLALANAAETDADRLAYINRPFLDHGLAPVRMREGARPAFEHLAAPEAVAASVDGPLVTVIVPVFNAAASLAVALRSLAEQTWANLEVIVVDDASTDNSLAVATAFAAGDSRFRVLSQPENQGAYCARNVGLAAAAGEYITCHDADDWSHPQKIELQMQSMRSRFGTLGSTTSWARVYPDMAFPSRLPPDCGYVYGNLSSFLFSAEVRRRLGRWDRVRASGDIEFMRRAEAAFGGGAFVGNLSRVPLSFALRLPTSLTQDRSTHDRTIFLGVRRTYLEAAARWRSTVASVDDLRFPPESEARAFPAPARFLPERAPPRRYDLVVGLDFNMVGGAYKSTMNYVHAALASGLRVALFQYPFFRLQVSQPLNPRILDLAAAGTVDIVDAGEPVVTDTLLFGYPVMLRYPLDDPPRVDFRHLVVIVNQMAYRLHGRRDAQYAPDEVARNLRAAYGTEGTWVPISGLVRRLMRDIPGYPPAHRETWTPLIDVTALSAAPLSWRGDTRALPVVGRHSRDHYTKWPSTREAILAAYCADRACTVRLLGGIAKALEVVGRQPANWEAFAFDTVNVEQFLDDIDFFIHYPHEDYIEEFGRAVVEAMAAGRPVLLAPVFRETFGEAALYPEPADVWPVIERLWRDRAAYLGRAEAGRAFIAANCGYDRLIGRLKNLDPPSV